MIDFKEVLNFLGYFAVSIFYLVVFINIYKITTKYNEVALIVSNNKSAAITYGASIVGFAFPLASAMVHSLSLANYTAWATVAMVIQIAVYLIFKFKYSDYDAQIENNNSALAILYASFAIGVGIINACALSW